MDMNQLLFNHQVAQMNADRPGLEALRETHFDLVGYYAKRITAWRRAQGLSDIGWPREQRRDVAG